MEKEYTILIIDDDEAMRKYLASALAAAGYKTVEADDGYAGIHLFQKITIHLVITDIYMPNMNGFELIQRLRELKSSVKIIAISGDVRQHQNHSLDWAKAAGAAAVLEKPFTPQVLTSTIQKILDI